jgi:HD-like signal output (HDOD) protein
MDHADCGLMIASSWKLEGPVRDVISCHHNYFEYEGPHRDILFTVAAANRFSCNAGIGFSGDCHAEKLAPAIWEELSVDRNVFFEFEEIINNEIDKAKIFLDV